MSDSGAPSDSAGNNTTGHIVDGTISAGAGPTGSPASARLHAPSLVELATTSVREQILNGSLQAGERIVESRLTEELGISRPPLREALRRLESEGLVRQIPRRGTIVTELTLHDVYELYTLRHEFEVLAVHLGVPVKDDAKLQRVRQCLAAMQQKANDPSATSLVREGMAFHEAIIGLSGNRRLEGAYRSLSLQIMLCMAMNRQARAYEPLAEDAARHQTLLDCIDTGDPEVVLDALARHGDRSFLDGIENRLDGHSPESLAWLESMRAGR